MPEIYGMAARSALRKEGKTLEEDDAIDMFPAPDRASGCLRRSYGSDAGTNTTE